MRVKIEFAIALLLSAAYWMWFFPLIGATSTAFSPWILSTVIASYAMITTLETQLFYGAAILLGARFSKFKQTLIFIALIASQLLPQYVICVLISLVIPGLVVSYAWFALAVVAAFVAQFLVFVAAGGIRDKADVRERHQAITLLITNEEAFLPSLKGTKLTRGPHLLIAKDKIEEAEELLAFAWSAMNKGDWPTADRYLMQAIPELLTCGYLGILRARAACIVLKQSHAALENQKAVEEYSLRIRYLDHIYNTRGAF